jgi:N-methylhydantoinase B
MNRLHAQIMWDRLLAIVEEQAQTLIRTAFSTTVREAGDLSSGVFDTQGRMLAQAVTGTPGHVNAMAASVGFFLAKHSLDTLEQGDVLLTNDPWHGTGHLNDFTVVTPVFHNGEAVALFAATSHIADVGGLGFGPDGTQVFEEGINLPIGYLFRRGEPNAVLLEILRANVRDPVAAEGDLHSLTACNKSGADSLLAMLDEFGLDNLDDVAAMIVDNSRDAMLREIRNIRARHQRATDLHPGLRVVWCALRNRQRHSEQRRFPLRCPGHGARGQHSQRTKASRRLGTSCYRANVARRRARLPGGTSRRPGAC